LIRQADDADRLTEATDGAPDILNRPHLLRGYPGTPEAVLAARAH
jgi:hypothetical protein